MSKALDLPLLGKRKEKAEKGATAFGGQSKKASRVAEKGATAFGGQSKKASRVAEKGATVFGGPSKKASRVVGSEGDDKEEEENESCGICFSNLPKAHTSRCCRWNVRIPLPFVPKVDANYMVVCKNCEKERPYANEEICACSCGYDGKYVCLKRCCACLKIGHKNNDDRACKYYGKTGEEDPFNKIVKKMLEELALDPESPY